MRFKKLFPLLLIVISFTSNLQSQNMCETKEDPIELNTINKCTALKDSPLNDKKAVQKLSIRFSSRLRYLKNKEKGLSDNKKK